MTIIISNLDTGVLPGNIGLTGEMVAQTSAENQGATTILTGDVSGSGTTVILTAIVPSAVTYAKIQNASASTILGNPSGSPTAISEITPGGGLVFSGNTLATPGGLLNKFRNGTMDVWQRGTTSITVSTAGKYTADGWIVTPTGASCTAIQAANNRSGANTLFGLQITGAASVTDITITQRIESYIAAAIAGDVVTVQAQVFNNAGVSITPTLTTKIAGSTDNWTSPTTDLAVTSLQSCANAAWTQIAYTFTVSTSANLGYEFIFDFGNNFSSTGKDVIIAELDVRVTPGVTTGLNSAPPPPELRPIFVELPFCQRYYYDPANGTSGTVFDYGGYSGAGTSQQAMIPFPVTMRSAPSATGRNLNLATNTSNLIFSTPTVAGIPTQLIAASQGNVGVAFNLMATAEL